MTMAGGGKGVQKPTVAPANLAGVVRRDEQKNRTLGGDLDCGDLPFPPVPVADALPQAIGFPGKANDFKIIRFGVHGRLDCGKPGDGTPAGLEVLAILSHDQNPPLVPFRSMKRQVTSAGVNEHSQFPEPCTGACPFGGLVPDACRDHANGGLIVAGKGGNVFNGHFEFHGVGLVTGEEWQNRRQGQ